MASQSQPLSALPSPLGSLATVPLEIRRMIYSLVLASSSSLIGTSSAIKDETLPMLYDHGIQRIRINLDPYIVLDFSNTCFYPRKRQRPSSCSVDHPGQRLDEERQALVKKISITVGVVQFDSLPSFRDTKSYPTFAEALGDFVAPMQKKQHCHIALSWGSIYELYVGSEPGLRDSLAPLQEFEAVTVEVKGWPWGFRNLYALFGTTEEPNEAVNSVIWFKRALGCDIEGWHKTGKKVKIIGTFMNSVNEREILWDSEVGDEEMGRTDEDVIMGEN